MTEYAGRLQNGTDTAPRVRIMDALPLFPGADAINARNGVRPGGGEVSVVEGTMNVQATPFSGWVDGGSSSTQGGYPFVLDATKGLTIADGDAVSARTDTVVARVSDNAFDASGVTEAVVEVVEGVPGAGAPALPTSCVPLRDITVPAGLSTGTGGLSSANLGADRRTYTAALGGILPVSGTTERDALNAHNGAAVYRADTDQLQVRTPAGWQNYQRADLPLFIAQATAQNIPDSGFTKVGGYSVARNDGGFSVTAGVVTLPESGPYEISGHLTFATQATGSRYMALVVNGSTVARDKFEAGALPGGSATRKLVGQAGDTVELHAWQNSGSSLALREGETGLSIEKLRD